MRLKRSVEALPAAMRLDVGCSLKEARRLNPELVKTCSEWMDLSGQNSAVNSEPFDDPFDMAVGCAFSIEIVSEDNGWEIPNFIVELAREKEK